MLKTVPAILLLFLLSGCVEEFDLKMPQTEPRLVVDALITNEPGPYLIRLTKSRNGDFYNHNQHYLDNAEPAKEAMVIISDNQGAVDTLTPMNWENINYQNDPSIGSFQVIMDEVGNIKDTVILPDPDYYNYDNGFYQTNKIAGRAGNTYYLKIIWNDKTYNAACFMPPVPKIDSIRFEKKTSGKDGQEYFTPRLYFKEPRDTVNFYLFQSNTQYSKYASTVTWEASVLSDEFLKGYINGLELKIGTSPSRTDYAWLTAGDEFHFSMSSLTKTGYNHYQSLIEQIKYDGGIYKPAPASPPTNLSNGALGLFRASAVENTCVIIK